MKVKFNNPFKMATTWTQLAVKYTIVVILIVLVMWVLGGVMEERHSPKRVAEAMALKIEREQATEEFRSCLKHATSVEVRDGCITTFAESKAR